MKKKSAKGAKKPAAQKPSGRVDKVAAELAEVKARKIPAKHLVWMFRIISANKKQLEALITECLQFFSDKLGKRCRVVLESAKVKRETFQDFILKPPGMTLELLRSLDEGMAEICARSKVKYVFLGFGEEVYEQASWKTLGNSLEPAEISAGDFDCRQLRFDGLYCQNLGELTSLYLRFYPDGQCISMNALGTANEVARWFRRERKVFPIGEYSLRGSKLSAVLELDSLRLELTAQLTERGLKVQMWSSHSNETSNRVYAFYQVPVH